MSRSDLIADSLTIIRNAVERNKNTVEIPSSNIIEAVIKIFQEEGFILNYKKMNLSTGFKLRIYLRNDSEGKNFITGIKRVSKPGVRVYKGSKEIPEVLNGLGVSILTTSKGIMTGKQAAEMKLGGEVICYVW